jgi:hypothetical protein
MKTDEFRQAGCQLVEKIADYWEHIQERPVTPDAL